MQLSETAKKELLKASAQTLVPLCQVGIEQYYQSKQLKRRQEHEVKLAQHKSQAIETAVVGEDGGGQSEPSPFERGGEYDDTDIESMEGTIMDAKCDWCKQIARDLREHPEPTRRRGLRELRELQAVMYDDPTKAEIDEKMDQLEIVPEIAIEG